MNEGTNTERGWKRRMCEKQVEAVTSGGKRSDSRKSKVIGLEGARSSWGKLREGKDEKRLK